MELRCSCLAFVADAKARDSQPMWFMDCFCEAALLGNEFPVNSYYHESLGILMQAGARLLQDPLSGIHEVSFARDTRGFSPMRLEDVDDAMRG